MKRLALGFAVVALAGCGADDKARKVTPAVSKWAESAREARVVIGRCAWQPRPGHGYMQECARSALRDERNTATEVRSALHGCDVEAGRLLGEIAATRSAQVEFVKLEDAVLNRERRAPEPLMRIEADVRRKVKLHVGNARDLAKKIDSGCPTA